MEFKKIGEGTVRCILTKDDMNEYDIKIEDFFKNSASIHDFLHMIVEKANEEVGYEPKDMSMISMQVMPLPRERLSITLTEGTERSLGNIFENIRDAMAEVAAEESDVMEAEIPEYDVPDVEEEPLPPAPTRVKTAMSSDVRVVRFAKLQNLLDYVEATEFKKGIATHLYYQEGTKEYVLVVKRGRCSKGDFERAVLKVADYGVIYSDSKEAIESIQEYGKCISKTKAVEYIKQLA